MRKVIVLFLALALGLSVPLQSHAGLFETNVDKAKDFMQAKMFPQAIALLEKEINEEPTNAEAHYQLGICYINKGSFSRADERFASAVALDSQFGQQIGKEWKSAGSQELNKGNISSAERLFSKAVDYQPSLKSSIAGSFVSTGEANPSIALKCFESALRFSPDNQETKKKIGIEYLKAAAQAWPNGSHKSLKEKATNILGEAKVQEVFPAPYDKVVFEQTFSHSDPKNKEWTRTFAWSEKFQPGDLIQILTKSANGPGKIYVYRGKEFTPKMTKVTSGEYKQKIEEFEVGKYFSIWLDTDTPSLKARVRVTRKISNPEPNISKLAGF